MAENSEADDARLRRVAEILVALNARKLPVAELAALERELDSIGRVLDPSLEGCPMIVYSEMEAFVERLQHRQGTITPDFQVLYQKKAEIDRKILRRDDH